MTAAQFRNKLKKFLFIKDTIKGNHDEFFDKYDTLIEDAMYNVTNKDPIINDLLKLYFNNPSLQPNEIAIKLDTICEKIDQQA